LESRNEVAFRTKSNSGLWFAQKNTLDARKSEYSATRYNHRRSPVKSPLMITAAAMALTMGSPASAQDCKGALAHPMVQCFAVEVVARMGSEYESPSAARQSFMNGWKPGSKREKLTSTASQRTKQPSLLCSV
jgi:hypothetical protein